MQPAPVRAPPWGDVKVHLWWYAARPGEDAPRARRGRLDSLLRRVLSRYVDDAPGALRFGREARGRPFLLDAAMQRVVTPDFNLSDTVGGTLIAVSQSGRVGVDLERTDRSLPHRKLARRYFAQIECERLEAMPEEEARHAFLLLWTAKEASCKSTGTGIFGQLPRWVFDPESDSPGLLAIPSEAGALSQWHHLRVTPALHYTAVLASNAPLSLPRGFALKD